MEVAGGDDETTVGRMVGRDLYFMYSHADRRLRFYRPGAPTEGEREHSASLLDAVMRPGDTVLEITVHHRGNGLMYASVARENAADAHYVYMETECSLAALREEDPALSQAELWSASAIAGRRAAWIRETAYLEELINEGR